MCKYDICTLQILYTDCRSKKKSSQYKQFCQNNVAHLIINLQKKGNQCPFCTGSIQSQYISKYTNVI